MGFNFLLGSLLYYIRRSKKINKLGSKDCFVLMDLVDSTILYTSLNNIIREKFKIFFIEIIWSHFILGAGTLQITTQHFFPSRNLGFWSKKANGWANIYIINKCVHN